MERSILEKSALFRGIPGDEAARILEATPHRIRRYERGQAVFHAADPALWTGIVLEGSLQMQKAFPNGSQVNVSVCAPGGLVGPAAVFSSERTYPCGVVALEPSAVLLLRRDALLALMQADARILENLVTEIASATFMLQQKLELLSYSGIAQRAAFFLLTQARRTGGTRIPIPGSMTKWALALNVSRPSLHRELKRLEAERILARAPHAVEILDPEALQDVLSR